MRNKSNTEDDFVDLLKTSYYGMVYLGLANVAYTSEGDKKVIADNLQYALTNTEYMPLLPPPPPEQYASVPDVSKGKWQLEWGPAIAEDNSNLIYVASYRLEDNSPLFYVVGVRGTDTSSTPEGIMQQIIQDIDDFSLQPWADLLDGKLDGFDQPPFVNKVGTADQKGQISKGSILGFLKLVTLSPANSYQRLVEQVNALLGEQCAPVIVTGHSLGGNQTQVVAAYLDWQFGEQTTVIPMPFAPPTPGNDDFANLPVFQNGLFWYNTLDLVPYAYIMMKDNTLGLDWAKENLWHSYKWPDNADGPELPDLMWAAIDKLGPDVPHTFHRPPDSTLMELTGNIPDVDLIKDLLESMGWLTKLLIDPKKGVAQLMWQHFPPCYKLLIKEQLSDQVAFYDFKSYQP